MFGGMKIISYLCIVNQKQWGWQGVLFEIETHCLLTI